MSALCAPPGAPLNAPLAGLRVLVAEDHYFVARELTGMLNNSGASVVGPVAALPIDAAVSEEEVDVALLDVDLRGQPVFPLLNDLLHRNIPVALVTGYARHMLPPAYRGLPMVDKPVDRNCLNAVLLKLAQQRQPVI